MLGNQVNSDKIKRNLDLISTCVRINDYFFFSWQLKILALRSSIGCIGYVITSTHIRNPWYIKTL